MRKTNFSVLCLILLLLSACETPKSPNFKVDHSVQAPLTFNKTYTFLGGESAIIDTTKEDYGDVFQYAENGLVSVVKEQDLDFANLDNAIPDVDVTPTGVNTPVGEIGLTSFNSSGNVGTAGFQNITGFSSPPKDQQISGGSGTVNVKFATEFFRSALIKKDGFLELTISNNLGFNIDELEISLNSGNSGIGQATIGTKDDSGDNFEHNSQRTAKISIPASTNLQDINVDFTVYWDLQKMQEEGDNLTINNVIGQDLVASEFSGAPESQTFRNTDSSPVDQSNFEFQTTDHFIELSSGDLSIEITNGIDLGVSALDIVFSDIVDADGNLLSINLKQIPSSSSGGTFSSSTDLSGYRIKAEGGVIDYEIDATTENVQDGFDSNSDSYRTIIETDELEAQVSLNNLSISRAEGYVVPKTLLLSEDATADGIDNLDVFNDSEAEITEIDGINELSDRLSDITFSNPILSTIYETNLGVNTTIYAVIAGTKPDGDPVYLTGKDGSKLSVSQNEIPDELKINGLEPETNQIIKFEVDTAETPLLDQGEEGSNIFNSSNTNTSEFFSNLPSNIRFVGVAKVNEKKRSGTIVNPVIFEPKFGVEIPFNFSADKAIFQDTVDADLGDLPGEGDDQELSSATLTLSYENGIPMGMDLTLNMMDGSGNVILTKEGITVNPASVNSSGFVEQGGISENSTEISFTNSELNKMNKVRSVELYATIDSPNNKSVKVRNSDTITFRINMKAKITSTVN